MSTDAGAQALLEEVVAEWRSGGLVDLLRATVATVWKADLDRYETKLGDDALSLGIQASRNICNLAAPVLDKVEGARARDVKTLEVEFRGRVLHVGKVASASESWSVEAMTWERDVRRRAAEENSKVFSSVAGTLFDDVDSCASEQTDPTPLRQLYLAWQGMPDGRTRCWLGFPSAEEGRSWFAVVRLDDDPGHEDGVPAPRHSSESETVNFDDLDETPLPPMSRRSRVGQTEPGA